MAPPFFTASLSSARAAVVPGRAGTSPGPSLPECGATLSPTAGVGASERSTIPKGTCSRREASCATNCPMRVTLKAVCLMVSATAPKSAPLHLLERALAPRPGR